MSSKVKEEEKDLLSSDFDIILQHSNCMTVRPHGLSASIANHYKYADPYGMRTPVSIYKNLCMPKDRPVPGPFLVQRPSDKEKGPVVLSLFAQLDFGKSGASSRVRMGEDSAKLRLEWFRKSLEQASK